jgi:hypothetical protein
LFPRKIAKKRHTANMRSSSVPRIPMPAANPRPDRRVPKEAFAADDVASFPPFFSTGGFPASATGSAVGFTVTSPSTGMTGATAAGVGATLGLGAGLVLSSTMMTSPSVVGSTWFGAGESEATGDGRATGSCAGATMTEVSDELLLAFSAAADGAGEGEPVISIKIGSPAGAGVETVATCTVVTRGGAELTCTAAAVTAAAVGGVVASAAG